MTTPEPGRTDVPLFMHKFQIKHELTTLILDNGSQKNLVSQELVQHMKLPTTPQMDPYQLGWVQKVGPHITIARCCTVTFSIGPFHDTVVCDVSPFDCVDLLPGLPYQQDRQVVYHSKSHQYNLQHEGHTYVLTSVPHTSPLPPPGKEENNHVIHHKYVSLCLVCPVNPKNLTNLTPPIVLPLLQELADVYQSPTRIPPSRSIVHSIDLIPDTSFPNAPSYRLSPKETTEIEQQIGQLLEFGHIQSSSSPCNSLALIIPKRRLLNSISLPITMPSPKPQLNITIPYPGLRIFSTTYKGPPSSPRWI
jgi:hypothetical protein